MNQELRYLLNQAAQGKGLSLEETAALIDSAADPDWPEIFSLAKQLTEEQFEKKIRFFAPLYFSNFCVNDCVYCGFKKSGSFPRKALKAEEFLCEARFIWNTGHRTLLLIASEHPHYSGPEQTAAYTEALQQAELRFFLMAELAPMSVRDYHALAQAGIRQCLLFQETYDRTLYAKLHSGPKKDFDWRYEAMARALEGGIERVGLGILLGCAPWREDLLALIRHAKELEKKFGKLPATFSFPRIRAAGSLPAYGRPIPDEIFNRILAVVRLALPSVGIVLTTREKPAFRDEHLAKGFAVTHMSAGSSTAPGGYTFEKHEQGHQFDVWDERSLEEVAKQVHANGFAPLFDCWSKPCSLKV